MHYSLTGVAIRSCLGCGKTKRSERDNTRSARPIDAAEKRPQVAQPSQNSRRTGSCQTSMPRQWPTHRGAWWAAAWQAHTAAGSACVLRRPSRATSSAQWAGGPGGCHCGVHAWPWPQHAAPAPVLSGSFGAPCAHVPCAVWGGNSTRLHFETCGSQRTRGHTGSSCTPQEPVMAPPLLSPTASAWHLNRALSPSTKSFSTTHATGCSRSMTSRPYICRHTCSQHHWGHKG